MSILPPAATNAQPPRPKLLDLFCGAGGASMGYHRAGFDVTGVDINPQKNYPFTFVQADAIHYLAEHWHEFDAIHASPPCQRFSAMSACRPGLSDEYPDLIAATRGLINLVGSPGVIENVVGSPLRPDVSLCGHMFGLKLYRHRIFESNRQMQQLEHAPHTLPASKAGHWRPGTIMSVSGHVSPIAVAKEAMGIDWMTRDELAESIPPAFTEHVGSQLLAHLSEEGPSTTDPATIERERIAQRIESVALEMVAYSDTEGTALTAAILQRAAQIARTDAA